MESTYAQARDLAAVNGTQLAFQVEGNGHALVLIHAGIADSRMWDGQFEDYARHFRTVRYDIRGFGRSVMPPEPYSDRDDLRELLRYLGIPRAHLVGVSKGAMIALDTCLAYPDVVDALVLVSPALGGRSPSAEAEEADARIDEVFESGNLDGAVELELRRWVDGPGREPEQVDSDVRERVRQMDADNFDMPGEGVEQALQPPAINRLREVRAPTLVIVGDEDVPDILANADLIAQSIAGAQLRTVSGAAHMLSMEKPAEFDRVVLDFLERQAR